MNINDLLVWGIESLTYVVWTKLEFYSSYLGELDSVRVRTGGVND